MMNIPLNLKEKSAALSGLILRFCLTGVFLLSFLSANAQFTITNDFRSSQPTGIITGGGGGTQGVASFTSGIVDPVGAGWLRLTASQTNQRGYAYIDKSFPSTLGVLVDFEYKMWRNDSNSTSEYYGGDGIGVFLFDATSTFQLGGYGGSLGYAPNTAGGVNQGLAGGYIGIGLDAYGNYGNNNEGRNGRITRDANNDDVVPNTVVLRGPTTTNSTSSTVNGVLPTNRFLFGTKLGDRSGTAGAIRQRNEVDYNTAPYNIRPTDSQFYRRVQIEIKPLGGSLYNIVVRWRKSGSGAFTELINYNTQDVPPSLLKLGFAASTGGAYNYHEIRNLLVTTPGNLRVTKRADKETLRSVASTNSANVITYTIEVTNDTDAALQNIIFSDKLTDTNGNLVPKTMFNIANITNSGFLSGTTLTQSTTTNEISGSLNLAANSVGIITVTGTLSSIPTGNTLKNTVNVMPTDITDNDLGNNTAVVTTPVIAEDVDLTLLKQTIGQECINYTTGNTYEIRVTNLGILEATYSRLGNNTNRIVVTKDIPTGYTYNDSQTNYTTSTATGGTERWYRTTQSITGGTRYTYVARGAANGAQTLNGSGIIMEPNFPIRYTITPPAGTQSYDDVAKVEYRGSNGADSFNGTDIELPVNRLNNTITQTVVSTPSQPTIPNSTIYYCMRETATALVATPSTGNTLIWYLNQGGTPATVAPTPLTTLAGTTRYYVSQTNGSCEGPTATIDVVVLPAPSAGSLGNSQILCLNGTPSAFSSTQNGTATGWPTGTTISYRWEISNDGSTNWTAIQGVTTATYTPAMLTAYGVRYYRRITLATINGHTCPSGVSNTVTLRMITPTPGSISGEQKVCSGQTPAQITSESVAMSISDAVITYRWEESFNNAAWTIVPNATATTYTPGVKNKIGIWKYRRIAIATVSGNSCETASNEVIITVKNCKTISNPMLPNKAKK